MEFSICEKSSLCNRMSNATRGSLAALINDRRDCCTFLGCKMLLYESGEYLNPNIYTRYVRFMRDSDFVPPS